MSAVNELLYVAMNDEYSGICSYLFLLVASCCQCDVSAVEEWTNSELLWNGNKRFSSILFLQRIRYRKLQALQAYVIAIFCYSYKSVRPSITRWYCVETA